jgi:hypothetical protein
MHFYMSGTPTNDPYQTVENRMNTHRLFSLHGDYEKACLKWVSDLAAGIFDAEAALKANPGLMDRIRAKDERRRVHQRTWGRTADWDTGEVLMDICRRLEGRPYPKAIMLDSGAFTAWNKGEKTTVDDVKRKYHRFLEIAGDMFEEIWMVNLDVIPGERGRNPTQRELEEALRVSDVNFAILESEFGQRILPVYHQGEDNARLDEVVKQVRGKSNYICVSPRNDLAENLRIQWSREKHKYLETKWPGTMTHGLATTGNVMVRTVPWYSGDSAAWVQHGGFGMIDIFHHEGATGGKKASAHYMNYFTTFDNVALDTHLTFPMPVRSETFSGEMWTSLSEQGFTTTSTDPNQMHLEMVAFLQELGVDPDKFPMNGGHFKHYHHRSPVEKAGDEAAKHYFNCSPDHRKYIRDRVEALGWPFEMCMWDSRVRNLICMAELVSFGEWAGGQEKAPAQVDLLGGL